MQRKSRLYVVVLPLIVFLLAACGGGGGGNTTTNNSSAGSPADAVKGFFDAVFAGEDVTALICTSNAEQAAAIAQGMETMRETLTSSGAEIDTSGLTYTVKSESGDTAEVEVSGNIKVTVSGVSQDQPYPAVPVPVRNEGGTWKVCG